VESNNYNSQMKIFVRVRKKDSENLLLLLPCTWKICRFRKNKINIIATTRKNPNSFRKVHPCTTANRQEKVTRLDAKLALLLTRSEVQPGKDPSLGQNLSYSNR
jgi:hypothetical protein